MKVHDISMEIYKNMKNYPGETKYRTKKIFDISRGDQGNSSELIISSHMGTHIDTLSHVTEVTNKLDNMDTILLGEAIVIEFGKNEKIKIDIIKKLGNQIINKFLILKTKNSFIRKDGDIDVNDYLRIDIKLANYLSEKKILGVGLDCLSIGNKEVHLELLKHNIKIIEGLELKNVKKGKYFFICLGLRFKQMDGIPARAILIEDLIDDEKLTDIT